MTRARILLVVLLAGVTTPRVAAVGLPAPSLVAVGGVQEAGGDLRAALQRALLSQPPALQLELAAVYQPDFEPLWVEPTGHPAPAANDALALLEDAGRDGLTPAEYQASLLRRTATTLSAQRSPTVASIAAFDSGLSAAVLRYLRHLHTGRIDPRAIGLRMTAETDAHHFADPLRAAVAAHRVRALAEALAPPLVLYRNLRTMLARYRDLAADSSLADVRLPESTVRPGSPFEASARLGSLLTRLGDMDPAVELSATSLYEEPLVSAIRRFQRRHGLADDGVIGAATRAALRVPLAVRVRQIELALERLRWLPHLDPERFLAVNIPMFQLWIWDAVPPTGAPSFGMNVIVGRSLDTRTPVFVEQMEHLVFRPFWNVPGSILRGEILPAIERDPAYLDRHDMEIVAGQSDHAQAVALTAETLSKLRRGQLRVRQRPGPANSLGLVKFVFPNDDNVYLHGTPARQLFGRARRDFSHGCVRVEDPVGLAEWALQREPGWNRDRILAAMNGTRTVQVKLSRPIQVFLFYVTAVVMPDDGSIHFAADIYGHDATLDRALHGVATSGSRHILRPGGGPDADTRVDEP